MAEDTGGHDTHIHGNIAKLTQIGTVNGDVLIVSEKAVRQSYLDRRNRRARRRDEKRYGVYAYG